MNKYALGLRIFIILFILTTTSLSYHYFGKAREAEEKLAAVELQKAANPASPKKDIADDSVPVSVFNRSQSELRDARKRIDVLEQQLSLKSGELKSGNTGSSTQSVQTVTAQLPEPEAAEPGERESWMDRMKREEPERYQEMVERRTAARKAAKYEMAKRTAYFLNRDVSYLTPEEAENNQRMVALLAETMDLTDQMASDLPGEERRGLFREMRNNIRELSPMMDEVRDIEFYQIGKDMGYSDQDAEAFSTYLKDVINLTSVHSMFRSTMGGMRGGGPRPEPRSE